MKKSGVNVLKKLGGRRKMFEDYINLIKKSGGERGRLRRETWEVGREKLKETLEIRREKWGLGPEN